MAREHVAFVVWLDRAGQDGGEISGQIEHVPSSRRQRFGSREELLRFLAQHRDRREPPPAPAPRPRP